MAFTSVGRCSPELCRECRSMFLTIESARLPCWTTRSRLPRSVSVISPIAALSGELLDELARQRREIIHEVERVLDLVRDARRQLPERRELLGLHKPILRS